jgi:hypothetical protein
VGELCARPVGKWKTDEARYAPRPFCVQLWIN